MSDNIVISYSHKDQAFVDELKAQLEVALSPYRLTAILLEGESAGSVPGVWIYPSQPIGEKYFEEIMRQITEALAVVIVLSEQSGGSEWVLQEIALAKRHDRLILPLALSDTDRLQRTPAGFAVGMRNWLNVSKSSADPASEIIRALLERGLIARAIIGETYRYDRPISAGRYGGVFEAINTRDGTRVVIKEIITRDRAVLAELDTKVQRLRQLSHRTLPKILSYFQEDDRHLIASELVRGESLRDALQRQRGPLPINLVVGWAEQLLKTLDYMHDNGVYHHGVKPQNIKRQGDQSIMLVDFGLDRHPQGQEATADPYLAPEQRDERVADARTDIFGLGTTLYSLLTGDLKPAPGAAPVYERNPQVPRSLSDVITRAMEQDPTRRFANTTDMLKALAEQSPPNLSTIETIRLSPAPVPQPSVPLSEQAPIEVPAEKLQGTSTAGPPNVRRRSVTFWLLGMIAALLVGMFIFFMPSSDPLVLAIAYSPEKEAWLSEQIAAFNKRAERVEGQQIEVRGQNISSGAASDAIQEGDLTPTIWSPSSSIWLEVLRNESNNPNIGASRGPLVQTPVVIAMWEPMADALGYPTAPLGWSDLIALSNDRDGWASYGHPEWGDFTWGYTDPEISTTGLSTLVAQLYAATGKEANLTVGDVQESRDFLRNLNQSVKHYGENTIAFSQNMQQFGMTYIAAVAMEEQTVVEFNQQGPAEDLVAIYPNDGTFWHDNPFIVMSTATPLEQQASEAFYRFLIEQQAQERAMALGFRPADQATPISATFQTHKGVQPNVPAATLVTPGADVLVAAKQQWAVNRKRADVLVVFDTSGSMQGDRLNNAKAGLNVFLNQILPEERMGLITFNTTPTVDVPFGPFSVNRTVIHDVVQASIADGGTALYDALLLARQKMEQLPPTDERRIKAVVVLSDGADRDSQRSLETVKQAYEESGILLLIVAYGEDAQDAQTRAALEQLAALSGFAIFEGDTNNIARLFAQLGYTL